MPGNEVNSGNGELDCGISGLAGNRAREFRPQASASGIKSDETPLRLTPRAAFVPGWRNLGGQGVLAKSVRRGHFLPKHSPSEGRQAIFRRRKSPRLKCGTGGHPCFIIRALLLSLPVKIL